jgi:hypothetical protein
LHNTAYSALIALNQVMTVCMLLLLLLPRLQELDGSARPQGARVQGAECSRQQQQQ